MSPRALHRDSFKSCRKKLDPSFSFGSSCAVNPVAEKIVENITRVTISDSSLAALNKSHLCFLSSRKNKTLNAFECVCVCVALEKDRELRINQLKRLNETWNWISYIYKPLEKNDPVCFAGGGSGYDDPAWLCFSICWSLFVIYEVSTKLKLVCILTKT